MPIVINNFTRIVCFLYLWYIAGLQEHGKDWGAIASMVRTKTDAQCREFYNTNKKNYNLDALTQEKEKVIEVIR